MQQAGGGGGLGDDLVLAATDQAGGDGTDPGVLLVERLDRPEAHVLLDVAEDALLLEDGGLHGTEGRVVEVTGLLGEAGDVLVDRGHGDTFQWAEPCEPTGTRRSGRMQSGKRQERERAPGKP